MVQIKLEATGHTADVTYEFISHMVQIKPFRFNRWILKIKLIYIPYGSDKTFSKNHSFNSLSLFISHMVQIKP